VKFAVAVAIVVLLLGMPVGCILVGASPAHPCCPRTNTNIKCPYDALDAAKIVGFAAIVPVPISVVAAITPPTSSVLRDLLPEVVEDQPDLYILNRILRV
jgi:hypothetical protein